MKRRAFWALSLAGLLSFVGLFTSASQLSRSFHTAPRQQSSPVAEPSQTEPSELQTEFCSPVKLYRGDTLTINMPMPHGVNLAVVVPDGTYFFITFTEYDKTSPIQPLIDREVFMRMSQIKLTTTEAKVIPWVEADEPDGTPKLIFTRR